MSFKNNYIIKALTYNLMLRLNRSISIWKK